jgi:hypothetical protein
MLNYFHLLELIPKRNVGRMIHTMYYKITSVAVFPYSYSGIFAGTTVTYLHYSIEEWIVLGKFADIRILLALV